VDILHWLTEERSVPTKDIVDVREQKRLNDAREGGDSVEKMGTLSFRATVGHGSRRLQPGRKRVGLFFP